MNARRDNSSRRGFTLIEAALSLVIVSVVAVAGLNAVSVARKSRTHATEEVQGRMYADGLLAEIVAKRYRDAALPASLLGPDATDDIGSAASRTVDDVDDYNGFAMSPMTDEGGNTLSSGSWGCNVTVEWVAASNPGNVSATESGVKRIRVAVYKGNRVVARSAALRTLGTDTAMMGVTP